LSEIERERLPTTVKRRKPSKATFQGEAEHAGDADATRAFVIHVEAKSRGAISPTDRLPASRLEEAIGLTEAIGVTIAASLIVPLAAPKPATLIGSGKVEEIAALVKENDTGLVIVNAQLSPIQQRNLERAWGAKVLDRTGLILEIFGERASTKEGTLQVELAHLQYQKSRLVRSWTHLERQRGGFGFLGGPGESQIEADRRLIQERISKIERQLTEVVKTRALHRKGRERVPYPVIALVGYTNAGKSTLFNKLTSANVLAKDMLFATLDPTMRTIPLPHGRKIILSDTVGFISDLPTALIAAFRATLEEVLEADVVLHVRDMNHVESEAQAKDVLQVLDHLGLSENNRNNLIEVWNKADLLDPVDHASLEAAASRRDDCTLVSSVKGTGLNRLLAMVEARLGGKADQYEVTLAAEDGKGVAWFHERAEVLARKDLASGKVKLRVRMSADRAGQAQNTYGKAVKKMKA
jgi:GTP-binding protein HflX